jgi:ABC-type multidrug transport system ATPase subunit
MQCGREELLSRSHAAGKTTLLDVLSQRKTTGTVTGRVSVNGEVVDKTNSNAFQRISGYVQQTDVFIGECPHHQQMSIVMCTCTALSIIHHVCPSFISFRCAHCYDVVAHSLWLWWRPGTATVREALAFSARLRLPTSTTASQRREMCAEVLRVLNLEAVADRMIGTSESRGISASQRKLLTIGLELVANPSILFVDGLDSLSVSVSVAAVANVSSRQLLVACCH